MVTPKPPYTQIYRARARPKTPTAPVNPTANAPVAAGAPPVEVEVLPAEDEPEAALVTVAVAGEVDAPPVVAAAAVPVAAVPVAAAVGASVTYAVYKYDLTLGGSEATQPGVWPSSIELARP